MKIGTLEILKAYLGSLELTNNNAFVGDVALISGGQPVPPVTIQPLTFTALEAGSTVKFNRSGVTSSYSIDGGTTWTSGDNVTVTLANVGDKVMLVKGGDMLDAGDEKIYIFKKDMIVCTVEEK